MVSRRSSFTTFLDHLLAKCNYYGRMAPEVQDEPPFVGEAKLLM